MRPWTTRTLHVALLAAGVAVLGSGTASATDLPGGTPEASGVPAQLGGTLPLALCQPPVPVQGQQTIPCADTTLGMQNPNVAKDAAQAIAGTATGVGGQLANGKPFTSPERVPALVGVAAHQVNKAAALDHQRPDAGIGLAPGNTGQLDKGTLLDAALSKHQPGAPGFSAADTQTDMSAVQGETLAPLAGSSGAVNQLTATQQTLSGTLGRGLPVTPDQLGQQLGGQTQQLAQPAGVRQVVGAVQGLAAQRATGRSAGLPELPAGQNNALPTSAVDQVTGQLTGVTNQTGGSRVPQLGGRHRAADPVTNGPLNQLPVVGQFAGQLNTPLGKGNPLEAVGVPVNTGDTALPGITNPAQALANPTRLPDPAQALSPARATRPARDLPVPSQLANPTQALGNPTQALGDPSQALGSATQGLSNPTQAIGQVTSLVTGVAGSH